MLSPFTLTSQLGMRRPACHPGIPFRNAADVIGRRRRQHIIASSDAPITSRSNYGSRFQTLGDSMNRVRLVSAVMVGLCALSRTHAAIVTWGVSPGVSDTEVSTLGEQVFGYYFNTTITRPGVVTVNTVPFTRVSSASAPGGLNFNGSYNNPEDF